MSIYIEDQGLPETDTYTPAPEPTVAVPNTPSETPPVAGPDASGATNEANYTYAGGASPVPGNAIQQLMDGAGMVGDFTYGNQSATGMLNRVTAPSSSPSMSSGSGGFWDSVMSYVGSVKPDTWAALAGKALEGYAQGKIAEKNFQLQQEGLELAKKKQSIAADSAASVKRPGLMNTYNSMFKKA